MSLYQQFAKVYASGYRGYSQTMAELLPAVIRHYHLAPGERLLDIACGEGSFAVAAAQQGWQVVGVDQSCDMLDLARAHALEAGVSAEFSCMDMRELDFSGQFDLATCWYDSLNYMLTAEDLGNAFKGVARALKPGGHFLFDMNTVYGLAVSWPRQPNAVRQDTPDLMEIHQTRYDHEAQIASVRIVAFLRKGDLWDRMEEVHQEKAYPVSTVQALLEAAGFEVAATLGNLREFIPLQLDSPRMWWLARKTA
mgnify:FL=1